SISRVRSAETRASSSSTFPATTVRPSTTSSGLASARAIARTSSMSAPGMPALGSVSMITRVGAVDTAGSPAAESRTGANGRSTGAAFPALQPRAPWPRITGEPPRRHGRPEPVRLRNRARPDPALLPPRAAGSGAAGRGARGADLREGRRHRPRGRHAGRLLRHQLRPGRRDRPRPGRQRQPGDDAVFRGVLRRDRPPDRFRADRDGGGGDRRHRLAALAVPLRGAARPGAEHRPEHRAVPQPPPGGDGPGGRRAPRAGGDAPGPDPEPAGGPPDGGPPPARGVAAGGGRTRGRAPGDGGGAGRAGRAPGLSPRGRVA